MLVCRLSQQQQAAQTEELQQKVQELEAKLRFETEREVSALSTWWDAEAEEPLKSASPL